MTRRGTGGKGGQRKCDTRKNKKAQKQTMEGELTGYAENFPLPRQTCTPQKIGGGEDWKNTHFMALGHEKREPIKNASQGGQKKK